MSHDVAVPAVPDRTGAVGSTRTTRTTATAATAAGTALSAFPSSVSTGEASTTSLTQAVASQQQPDPRTKNDINITDAACQEQPRPASAVRDPLSLAGSAAGSTGSAGVTEWPVGSRLLHADEVVEIRLVALSGALDRRLVQLARSAELYAFLGFDAVGHAEDPALYVGESGDRRGRRVATSLRRVTLSLAAMRATQLLVVSCPAASLSWAARRHVESLVLRQVTLRYVTVNRMTGCPTAAALLSPVERQAGEHIAQAVCAAIEVAFDGRQAVSPRGGNLCDAIVRAIGQTGRAVDRQELLAMAVDGRVPLATQTPWQSLRRDLEIREPANADQARVLSADVPGIGRLWWPAELDQRTAVDRYRRHLSRAAS